MQNARIAMERVVNVPIDQLQGSDVIHHTDMPKDVLLRIKAVWLLTRDVDSTSLQDSINCFRRDEIYSRELDVMERIAFTYSEVTASGSYGYDKRRSIYAALLMLSFGLDGSDNSGLSEDSLRELRRMGDEHVPVIGTPDRSVPKMRWVKKPGGFKAART
jgi:hypothetical protein